MAGAVKYSRVSTAGTTAAAGSASRLGTWFKYAMIFVATVLVLRLGFSGPSTPSRSSGSGSSEVDEDTEYDDIDGGAEEGWAGDGDDNLGDLSNFQRERFHVFVLGWKRWSSMERLLASLAAADYLGDKVGLHIHIDGGSGKDWEKSISIAKAFQWDFGSKNVRVSEKNGGLATSWLTAWVPASDNEHAIILEDDLVVSKYFYRYIKRMYQAYGDRPEIAGVTLQRGTLVATGGHKKKESLDPFAYKLLGSWGYSPHPRWWRQFIELDFKHLDPSVPHLITTRWFNRQKRGKMWTQYWIWFCNEHNIYTVYLNAPMRHSFGVNYREKGVHYGHTYGPDGHAITEWNPRWDKPPVELELYGWNYKQEGVSHPRSDGDSPAVKVEVWHDKTDGGEEKKSEGKVDEVPEEETMEESEEEKTDDEIGQLSEEVKDDLVDGGSGDEDSGDDDFFEGIHSEALHHGDENTEGDTTALVETARKTMKEGMFFMQLLNEGFVEMTKSWICNVNALPNVLDRTLFICTDQAAFDQLVEFQKTSGVQLHLHLQKHHAPAAMHYGQMQYYLFILFRAHLLNALLQAGVGVFLVEADAAWFGDVVHYLLHELDPKLDVVCMHNGISGRSLNGGFLWFKHTPYTKEVIAKLYRGYSRRIARLQRKQESDVGAAGNEQLYITNLLFRKSVNPNADKINVMYLPAQKFSSGLWFKSAHKDFMLDTHVVLNNWIRGNAKKVVRAKQWGQWLLSEDAQTCDTGKFTYLPKGVIPMLADFGLTRWWRPDPLVAFVKDIKDKAPDMQALKLMFINDNNVDQVKSWLCSMGEFGQVLRETVFVAEAKSLSEDVATFVANAASLPDALNIYLEEDWSEEHSKYLRAAMTYVLVQQGHNVLFLSPIVTWFAEPDLKALVEGTADAFTANAKEPAVTQPMALFKPTESTLKMMRKFVASSQKYFQLTSAKIAEDKVAIKTATHGNLGVQVVGTSASFDPEARTAPLVMFDVATPVSADAKVSRAKALKLWHLSGDGTQCA